MNRGGFSRGGRGGGRGGSRGGFGRPDQIPDEVLELGVYMHACEGEMVCKSTNAKIPYFNAPVFLSNKTQIGKIDEILGPINEVYFTIKLSEGVIASSFKVDDKVYVGSDKLLPIERFLPKPPVDKAAKPKGQKGGRGGGRGGARGGGRGGGRGGFGGGRGGGRGGFGGGRGGGRGGFGGGRGGFGGGRGGGRGGFGGGRGGRGGY